MIFAFRLSASEHKRTRCSCVRWRRREVAKQDKNWMVGGKLGGGDVEAEEANKGKRGNNETVK